MPIISQNPATLQTYATFDPLTAIQLSHSLDLAQKSFTMWKTTSFDERATLMRTFAQVMETKKHTLAQTITEEMGCPLSQTLKEVEKCILIANIFAENTQEMLKNEAVRLDAKEAYVRFDPLGTLLHIAPWNYPLYLALRPVIPALMAGNTVVLKHASNVPRTAMHIQKLFHDAGFPEGVYQTLLISSSQVESVIEHPAISLVSFIGSEYAGSIVASQAGKAIKKTIMELGGNDPMIILADADIDAAVAGAVQSRIRNCGQSCNASKRFVVEAAVHDEFVAKLKVAFSSQTIGDPLLDATDIGPLATESSRTDIQKQIDDSVKQGARVEMGGKARDGAGYFYEPTIIVGAKSGMPVYDEEVFGPVATVIKVQGVAEAIKVANDSKYGLGASIWTAGYDLANTLIPSIEAGNVYVNSIVRGEPNMPFGGVKLSGYGREFGEYGLKEFVNIKSVVVK
jgi:succinate-semialdehyde dehydrogenase / glutarate-semialdehyde dehydrogenase